MKMIAQHTIDTSRLVREATPQEKKDGKKDEYESISYAPDTTFEVDDNTARQIIASGAARKWKPPEEDEGPVKVLDVRATPPASGATRAPDPNAVADRSMAGENLDQFREEPETEHHDKTGKGDKKAAKPEKA